MGTESLFKRKKSEIHNRAKRLLGAFSTEARKQASFRGPRKKLIRAQYENGLLVLKEDFVKLSYGQSTYAPNPAHQAGKLNETQTKAMQIVFPKAQVQSVSTFEVGQLTGKEKLRLVLNEIVQMYSLQFKIVDELLGILKGELQKF